MAKQPAVEGPALFIHPATVKTRVSIGKADEGEVIVPATFTAMFKCSGAMVEIDIAAEVGRVRATELRLTERDEGGIKGVTIDGLAVGDLVSKAASNMAWMSSRVGRLDVRATAEAASRRRVSDDRLGAVADAFTRGGIEAVMNEQHVGERQAWRLKKRAVEEGLLTGEES